MAKNSVAANLLMVFFLLGGALSLPSIRQEVFPEFQRDLIVVKVAYPGASPAEVEQGLILAVEEAVVGIDGIEETSSTAAEGMATVSISLRADIDPDRALSDVKAAIDRITSFPEDAERPVVALAQARRHVLSLVIHGDRSERELRLLAEQARDDLLESSKITYAELSAVRPYEISVEVPQANLRRYGLTLTQIAERISRASVEIPGGAVRTPSGEVLLRTTERRRTGAEFGEVVLASQSDGTEVRVRDVAEVVDGFTDAEQDAHFNGQRATLVQVYRVGEETPIEISDAVAEFIRENENQLPAGVEYSVWFDSSETYRDRVDLLVRDAYQGLALVLIVLAVFLEIRLAFWVTLGIPISFLGSLLVMPAADVSFNMVSLFAFIVTLGIVVDDAIVIGDAVYEHRRRGLGPLDAAIAGVREVAVPVTFAVLTTCIAFSPLLFVPGSAGKLFAHIPIVAITVLLVSLIESLFILPSHLAHTGETTNRTLLSLRRRQEHFTAAFDSFIEKTYRPVVATCVSNRYLVAFAAIALVIATTGLVAGRRVQFSFIPDVEREIISAQVALPVGSAIEETRRIRAQLEDGLGRVVAAHGGPAGLVRGIYSQAGAQDLTTGAFSSTTITGTHLAQVSVYLVPPDDRTLTSTQLAERWRREVGDIAGVETLHYEYSAGPSGSKPIALELSHRDIATLASAAGELAAVLDGRGGVTEVEDGLSRGKEQLDFRIRPEARHLGLTELDVAEQVRAAFFGAEAVRQQRGRDEVRTYVRLPLAERRSLYDVESLLIRTPEGGELPLDQAAEVVRGRSYTQISRVDRRRVVTVKASVEQGTNATEVVRDLEATELPRLLTEYPGLRYRVAGSQRSQSEAISSLVRGFWLAVLAMFGLLAVEFRSYIQPLIVLVAIPFGMVGAVLGHLVLGYDLSIVSVMGMIALAGVVVNDSLLLVVTANRYRAGGLDSAEAVRTAATSRFRPILMTSSTTFFGLIPMILETSLQAQFLVPMAISLGVGVVFATFITLLLVPSIYVVLDDMKRGAARVSNFFFGP